MAGTYQLSISISLMSVETQTLPENVLFILFPAHIPPWEMPRWEMPRRMACTAYCCSECAQQPYHLTSLSQSDSCGAHTRCTPKLQKVFSIASRYIHILSRSDDVNSFFIRSYTLQPTVERDILPKPYCFIILSHT